MSSAQGHAHVARTCHVQVRGAGRQGVSRTPMSSSNCEFAAEKSAGQDEVADMHTEERPGDAKGLPRSGLNGRRAISATASVRYANVEAPMTPQALKQVAWADAGSGDRRLLEESNILSPPRAPGCRRLCRNQRQERQQQKPCFRPHSCEHPDESTVQAPAALSFNALGHQGSIVPAQEGDAAAGSGHDREASSPEGDAAAGSARESFGQTLQQKCQHHTPSAVVVASGLLNEPEAAGGLRKPHAASAAAPADMTLRQCENLHRPSGTSRDSSLGRPSAAEDRSASAAVRVEVSCVSAEVRGRAIGSLGPPLSRQVSPAKYTQRSDWSPRFSPDAGRTAAAAIAMAHAASAAAAAAQAVAEAAWLLADAQRHDDRLLKQGSARWNAADPVPPRVTRSPSSGASRVGCWSPGPGPRGGFPPTPAPAVLENLRGGPVRARREGFRQDELRSLVFGRVNVGRTHSPAAFQPARRGLRTPVASPARGGSQAAMDTSPADGP
eukprot:TRINITY_DN17392_c0_g1_i1.p1 TRINITY_DN17392_c0_g1~~TRINITY_DN17392_c0_g1_i1.p1  ORF type:complete len:519 (-),score=70.87 TRINITY_DN17392_c0_g1_i1:188-1678(-)